MQHPAAGVQVHRTGHAGVEAANGSQNVDAGEVFASRVRTAFAELSAAVTELTARANPRQLRVSVMPSFAARQPRP